MENFHVYFLCDPKPAKVKTLWAIALSFLAEVDVLPRELRRTGSSRKRAMRNVIDLKDPEQVMSEMQRRMTPDSWPYFVVYSLWAPAPDRKSDEDWRVSFETFERAGEIFIKMGLCLPEGSAELFKSVIAELPDMSGCAVLGLEFSVSEAEIIATWSEPSGWRATGKADDAVLKRLGRSDP